MMIKRIIFNIALVIVVLFVLDSAIGRTLRYLYFKQTSGFDFRTTYALETTRADLLVFGSSSANHHYVPEVFEDSLKMSFYNTGRDGNGIFFQIAVLKSVLKRYTPQMIILDYRGSFGKEAEDYDRMASLLPYYRTHQEIRKIVELKSPFERIKLASEIYPFNSLILRIAIGNLELNKNRVPDNKGYVALHNNWQAEIDSNNSYITYAADPNKLKALRDFIHLTRLSGIKLIVIHSPFFLRYNRSQEIEICREVCAGENVPFWDYSRDTLFLNHKHLFDDRSHLNHEGATLFSNVIVKKIKQEIFKAAP